MMQYTNKELEKNYNNFLEGIQNSFTGERLEKLLHMYSMEELGPNLILSPASGNINYHNGYDGGYIDHIMNVVRNSLQMAALYKKQGGMVDWTQEELLFSAFHHDLGKLGEKNEMWYIKNPSDWHVKNQGKLYIGNPELQWMSLTDRTVYLLNIYGIKYTQKEFLTMKLTDGLYDEENTSYLKSWSPDNALKTELPHILHWADHMSSRIELQIQQNAPF